MTKSVKTYPWKNQENWVEFWEFPGKNIAISREFPGREIPAVNPTLEDAVANFNWRSWCCGISLFFQEIFLFS